MSEKQLRKEAIVPSTYHSGVRCLFCYRYVLERKPDGLEHSETCPMAADPDVVAVAKRGRHYLELAGGDPGDPINPYDPLTERGRIWWRGYRQGIADDLSDIQEQFGFILSDDGWKWTNDAQVD